MLESSPIGTMAFLAYVVSPETPERGSKCKTVVLARFYGVRRDECEALKEKFFESNPWVMPRDVLAEWTCREIV